MGDDSAPDLCTISMDNRTICGDPAIVDCPIPICISHASMLVGFMNEQLTATVDSLPGNEDISKYRVLAIVGEGVRDGMARGKRNQADHGVIYYVRVGDMIKIGYTTRLKQRMSQYPPGSILLATEPGNLELEKQRHEELVGSLAAGKEWFAPTKAVFARIEQVKQAQSVA